MKFKLLAIAGMAAAISASVIPNTASAISNQRDVQACLEEQADLPLEDHLGVTIRTNDRNSVERYGLQISKADAARLDRMDRQRQNIDIDALRQDAVDMLGDNLVSIGWSAQRGVEIRVKNPSQVNGPDRQRLSDDHKLGRDYRILPVPNAMSETQRTKALQRLAQNGDILVDLGIVSVSGDEYCGKVIVRVEVNSNIDATRQKLVEITGSDPGYLEINYATTGDYGEDAVGRADFQSTQSGGLQYRAGGGYCTSNLPWKDANGAMYLVTAAHCIPQANWSSTPPQWGGAWWTEVTSNNNLRQSTTNTNGTLIATAQARLRYGAEFDVAVWPVRWNITGAAMRTATNVSTVGYRWQNHGWWQWSGTWSTSTSGGDAVGDTVCQSGVTQSFRAPQTSDGRRTVCALLINRNLQFSRSGSWFYGLRLTSNTNQMACGGDSGGPVWRGAWLNGIVKGSRGTSSPNVNGQTCRQQMEYTHVAFLQNRFFDLTAPHGWN